MILKCVLNGLASHICSQAGNLCIRAMSVLSITDWLSSAEISTSSSPTSLLKQCQLEQFALDHVQLGFEYLHWWWLHNPSGWPVPVFFHPHCTKMFLVQMEFFCILTGAHCPLPCQCLLVRRAPFPHLYTLMIPVSLLFSRLNSSALSLSSQEGCSSALIILVTLHWVLSNISSHKREKHKTCTGI